MLYKKYHRDFVKQFKRGSRFKFTFSNSTEAIIEVIKEQPIIEFTLMGEKPYISTEYTRITVGTDKNFGLPLVYWNGQLVERYRNVV